jgi:alkanesulfonate monooxygenase SsuD/methylene tetrahydromethanopterin reductase-like flavin-dependent oxidoreductase (luciferase family)
MERARMAQQRERRIVGNAERVRAALDELRHATGAREVVVLTICHDKLARQRSYELVAEAFGLPAG